MALTDTAGGTQTDPGTGKPSENPPAAPNKPTPPKEETPPGAPEKYAFTAPEGHGTRYQRAGAVRTSGA